MSKNRKNREHDRFDHRSNAYRKYEAQRHREEELEEEMYEELNGTEEELRNTQA